MKLKNIYIGILSVFLIGIFTSCDSFLEEEPKTNPQKLESAFHVRGAVNILYRSGMPKFYEAGVYNGAKIMFGSYLSGFYYNEYRGQEVIAQYAPELTLDSKNISRNMEDIYDPCYEAISRANSALKYAPIISDVSFTLEEREQLMAQASFFRAINYFYLVKFFGGVPLVVEPYESLDNLYLERASIEDIYKLIEADLLYALGEKRLPNEIFTKDRRVTKTMAETLLADVYLTMSGFPLQANRYADAAKYAQSVITGGLHKLTENGATPETSAYNQIRTNDNLSEIVYSFEFDTDIAKSNWVQLSFPVIEAGKGKYVLTNNASQPVKELRNIYDPAKDLRIQERQFLFNSYTYADGKTVTFEAPSQWFYFDEKAMFETGLSGRDFPIYRYAEVLLIAAEALVKGGGSKATAADYLSQVRARAYQVDKSTLQTALAALANDKLVEEIWTEHSREFLLEHKIWDKIQRTRMYPTTSDANKGVVTYVNLVGAKNPLGATFQEKHLLWPISDNTMQDNPSLVQNPGY